MNNCAYAECGLPFEAKTHNQRYCSDDCCRRATNIRIMKQYYERKARREGHIRVCETADCNTRLSRYNDGRVCQKCLAEAAQSNHAKLLQMIGMR